MPHKNNSYSTINNRNIFQLFQQESNSLQNSSTDDDNDEIQNNSMESEEEQSSIESDSNSEREFQSENYIDFPDMNLFQNSKGQVLPIPEDYLFNDSQTYQKTMNKLEQERFFKTIRHSLRENVFKETNKLKNKREESTYDSFQWIQEYQVIDIEFNQNGLILIVSASMKIQRYQQKQWETLPNQIMIFVNKQSKKYFVGKIVTSNQKQQILPFESKKQDESSLQKNENLNLLIENTLQKQIDKKIAEYEEIQKVKNILRENNEDFDIINLNQTFEIKMNVLSDIKEFLVNISQINKNYILLTPHEYWFQTQQSLNCQLKFAQLKQIQFEDQTVNGQKGESKFPQYSFLNWGDGLEKSQIQLIKKEIYKKKDLLDSYQLEALQYALNNQNAVIQGPPGTGKTFLASHIIHTLQILKNKFCNKPILIISKKNISLDQLLQNLEKIDPEIKLLRLGYQTDFNEMKKYTVQGQGGPLKFQIYEEGYQLIDKKLQSYLKRNQYQDSQSVNNSQLDESVHNQNFIKEQEIEIFLQEMRSYEQSNLKNYVEQERKHQQRLSRFMKKFQFIGMTLTGYHTYFEALQLLGAEIIVVEEASEINESEFFPILTPNVKHLIQFGDHQQLKPLIRNTSLIREFNYGMSYFERLIKVNKIDYVTLYQQKRMRPELANFTRLFYGNKYKDDKVVNQRSCATELSTVGVYLVPHTYSDQRMSEGSYVNQFEVYYIERLVKKIFEIKKQNHKEKYEQKNITILSMYRSQKELIQSKLKNLVNIQIFTVDEFQGNENDIIILSCVRSNKNNECGFVTQPHRINVAFSRAKIGLFCIGNFEMYSKKCQKWQEIVKLSLNQCSYGGINQMPLYKEIDKLTQFQFEVNFYRKGQQQQNICNLCYQKSHIGFCYQAHQDITFYDHFLKIFEHNFQNVQQEKTLIADDQQERQINLYQNLNISQINNYEAANSESQSEIDQLLQNMEEKKEDKNINQNKIQNRKNEKYFLIDDEKENSFQSSKKQKQKFSKKPKKQMLNQTQNLSINQNNSK
ncbi:AAA domain protein (macronuclear) [Tetrahymena thermophila SB210]|uniref:AAA domain protein n=1 Tax=Tetrahymena thermophila (strain SB210) TaxID=312017 RepID=Q235A9_TETTS|nr:AAA domain protein [Tetrahymena thermophila SB210]EAR91844.2 AAA domain protein [Tetrahymena thermophila SB210]|eukprot:XP_001012089.2 AAA domain protein [Tetrahymena thermophila SB210]